MGAFQRSGWAGVLGVVVLGGSLTACLEDRSGSAPSSFADPDSVGLGVRIAAPFESSSGAADPAEAWDTCAETANQCLGTSEDPIGCIRGYVVCVVEAGLDAGHPYLVCLEGLATCWEGSEELGAQEACVLAYEDCVDAYLATVPSEPTEPDDSTGSETPTGPETPAEPADPADSADPYATCNDRAIACFEERPEDELGCVIDYRDCVVEVGVDPAFAGCLDSVIACLGAGGDADACYEAFDFCVTSAYPEEPGHEPAPEPDDHEWAVCEEPAVTCYELGGTNAECLSVYRSCLIDYGLATDDPRIGCVDTLISCVGPAEASADPDPALELCADDFNACLGVAIE